MQLIGIFPFYYNQAKKALEDFAKETGRKLHLEIEPGTFLMANACSVVTTVQASCKGS